MQQGMKLISQKKLANQLSFCPEYKVLLSRPAFRELFYFSIWLGQGVTWGGHSMFCISACLAECGSRQLSIVASDWESYLGSLFCHLSCG
jgi:hypothetical protein